MVNLMEIGEKRNPTIARRKDVAVMGTSNSTYGPTPMHKRSLKIAQFQFKELKSILDNILTKQMPEIEEALRKAGAPWVEGQPLPEL